MSNHPSFEKAFARLEEILNKMSSGAVPLDESLSLYEEADKLIETCSKKLNEAEKKIQLLIKTQDQKIAVDKSGKPQTVDYSSNHEQLLRDSR